MQVAGQLIGGRGCAGLSTAPGDWGLAKLPSETRSLLADAAEVMRELADS